MSRLESLVNELFLDIFEYLDDVHLFRAFYGLKSRVNDLLSARYRLAHFDFRSIYREDFNSICQHYLPSIIDRTVSLHLSEHDDTPEQVNLFLSLTPSLDQFTRLQSLSLSDLPDPYIIHRILLPLHNLIRLDLSACSGNCDIPYSTQLIDTIWTLPKLISCKLQNLLPHELFHFAPTVQSSSLQHLIIDDFDRDFTELSRLCQYTPFLQYLQISIWDTFSSESTPLLSLTRLKLSFRGSMQVLINILEIAPNLECLMIRTLGILVDGCQWEQMINDYLPKLQSFRLLMQYGGMLQEIDEGRIDNVFRTFQKEFWLEKRRWFIQYHWNEWRSLCFYTLPYSFDDFVYHNNLRSQSTCPDELQHRVCDRVHCLWYEIGLNRGIPIDSLLRFSNIRYLHLDLPSNEHLWSILPTMHSLLTLTIERFNNGQALSQLQSLLDRARNLHSLTFTSPCISLKLFFQLSCSTIRQLNFLDYTHYFTKQQCHALIRSSFGQHCEVLSIKIKKRSDILQLVTKIKPLRTLIFQCDDHSEGDQLIDWLSARVPSTCFISADPRSSTIRIWVR